MEYAVRTEGIARSFGDVRAVDGIDLADTRRGDIRIPRTEWSREDHAGPDAHYSADADLWSRSSGRV